MEFIYPKVINEFLKELFNSWTVGGCWWMYVFWQNEEFIDAVAWNPVIEQIIYSWKNIYAHKVSQSFILSRNSLMNPDWLTSKSCLPSLQADTPGLPQLWNIDRINFHIIVRLCGKSWPLARRLTTGTGDNHESGSQISNTWLCTLRSCCDVRKLHIKIKRIFK